MKPHLRIVANESASNRLQTVLRRPTNASVRPREYLQNDELRALIKAAKDNRHGLRDSLMISMAYWHGLRVTELISLQWAHVDFKANQLHVQRLKGSSATTQQLRPDARALLKALRKAEPDNIFIFTTERGSKFTAGGFAKLIERAGIAAGLSFKAHPHMLKHTAAVAARNKGADLKDLQEFFGHKSITSTARYAAVSTERTKNIIESL